MSRQRKSHSKFASRSRSRKKELQQRSEGRHSGQSRQTYTGRVAKHADGFAFLIEQNQAIPDTFVTRDEALPLLHNDRVEFSVQRRGPRSFAKILKVIKRASSTTVGQIFVRGRTPYFQNLAGEFFEVENVNCPSGSWALARFEEFPSRSQPGLVSIDRVLGNRLLPKHDRDVAISQYGLPNVFSREALSQIQAAPEWIQQERSNARRKDLRSLPLVTIDGEDAKDFDDAIYVERTAHGYVLYVAIADVSFFVREHSAIDEDAKVRGTSVYFPGSVIPMLPEALSNDLCSLRPKEERLAFTAEIHLDDQGKIQRSVFYESWIQTKARLTYRQVQNFFDGKDGIEPSLHPALKTAQQLFQKLLKIRKQRGTLDFVLPETEIRVDAEGNPVEIGRASHFPAHQLIEEFMIAANHVVAETLRKAGVPSLYRVHESPDPKSLDEINHLLAGLGFSQRIEMLTPIAFSQILAATLGKKGASTLHQHLLRQQKQAKYTPHPHGHFGLALKDYTHFTSPIRRYPDLVVHRALKQVIYGKQKSDKRNAGLSGWEELGMLTSDRERRAMEAERYIRRRKQCWYLLPKVGEAFPGTISSVLSQGLFVELGETGIEGYLPVASLSGFYEYDERRMCLRKRPGNELVSVGDRIPVFIEEVLVEAGRITLGPGSNEKKR